MSDQFSDNIPEESLPETGSFDEIANQLQSLLSNVTEREHKSRRRAFYLTVIPAALALILLMGTGLQMRSANRAVTAARDELDSTEIELMSLSLELDNTNAKLVTANREVIEAKTALTETLVTLEKVTSDLLLTQEQLAQKENEFAGLQKEFDGLQEKVKTYNQEIMDLKRQIDELQQSLDSVREELRATIDLKRYQFVGDWLLTVKNVATVYPAAGALLQTIVELQDVPWRTGSFSADEGFDSPSFAAYVLQVNDRLELNDSASRYQLINLLPARRGSPQVGDLVFYEGGYTMFFFLDEQGLPFVIGMTTQGVLALTPDFAPVRGYGITGP